MKHSRGSVVTWHWHQHQKQDEAEETQFQITQSGNLRTIFLAGHREDREKRALELVSLQTRSKILTVETKLNHPAKEEEEEEEQSQRMKRMRKMVEMGCWKQVEEEEDLQEQKQQKIENRVGLGHLSAEEKSRLFPRPSRGLALAAPTLFLSP